MSENEPPTVKEKPAKLRLNFETFGSISAIVVGVAALFVSLYHVRVLEAQRHATVRPILSIDQVSRTDGGRIYFEFSITNAGVGPAILQSATLVDGQNELNSWDALNERLPATIPQPEPDLVFGASIQGRALAPGDIITPHGSVWENIENSSNLSNQIQEAHSNVSLSVCYCSVFDRCWVTSSSITAGAPELIDSCPISNSNIR